MKRSAWKAYVKLLVGTVFLLNVGVRSAIPLPSTGESGPDTAAGALGSLLGLAIGFSIGVSCLVSGIRDLRGRKDV